MRRRQYLVTLGGALGSSVAGCLGEPRLEYLARPVDFDLHQAGEYPDHDPGVTWFQDVEDAMTAIDSQRWHDEADRSDARAFVAPDDDNDVELLEIVAGGPSRGNVEIEVEYLLNTEHSIQGVAEVVGGEAAGDARYTAAIVRFTPPADMPSIVRIEVTNGWDETREYVDYDQRDALPAGDLD